MPMTFKKMPTTVVSVKVVEPKEENPPAADEGCVATWLQKHYKLLFLVFLAGLGLMSFYRVHRFKRVHTMKKLKCKMENKVALCSGTPSLTSTFIVEVSESCASAIYEVGGYPFSVAKHTASNIFKVPARELTIKNIVGSCTVNAYLDSTSVQLKSPFTWVTTAQHRSFTLKNGNELLAYEVSASLFSSVTNGRWIAYTFDVPRTTEPVTVTGDGSDIIFTYGVRG